MKIIKLDNLDLEKLSTFDWHPNLFRMSLHGKNYILKRFEVTMYKGVYKGVADFVLSHEIATVKSLNKHAHLFTRELCIPEYLVQANETIIGHLTKEVEDAITLEATLKNPDIPINLKMKYLKEVGLMLKRCDFARKALGTFALNDLHEENILVTKADDQIHVVDMAAAAIGSNYPERAKYLAPCSFLASSLSKNSAKNYNYEKPSRDNDLYCYIIMILNYLAGVDISNLNREKFYAYLVYLEKNGLNRELVNMFKLLGENEPNQNPSLLLDAISAKTLSFSRTYFNAKKNSNY